MDYSAKIATHIASIPRSGIRDFFELVQGRDDVISLGVGEPDFVTPWHIREAAIYSLEKGETCYTSNLGLLSLRKAISRTWSHFFHVALRSGEGNPRDGRRERGHRHRVARAAQPRRRGDLPRAVLRVLQPEHRHGRWRAGAGADHQGGRILAQAGSRRRRPSRRAPRIIMLNFPTNPTGACASRDELEGIAKLAIEHDLIVITDEIYSELRYDGRRTARLHRLVAGDEGADRSCSTGFPRPSR